MRVDPSLQSMHKHIQLLKTSLNECSFPKGMSILLDCAKSSQGKACVFTVQGQKACDYVKAAALSIPDTSLSIEGELFQADIHERAGVTMSEMPVLKRQTRSPQLDFVVVPLRGTNTDLCLAHLLPRIGIRYA